MESSPLQRLPREIRDMIYELSVIQEDDIVLELTPPLERLYRGVDDLAGFLTYFGSRINPPLAPLGRDFKGIARRLFLINREDDILLHLNSPLEQPVQEVRDLAETLANYSDAGSLLAGGLISTLERLSREIHDIIYEINLYEGNGMVLNLSHVRGLK